MTPERNSSQSNTASVENVFVMNPPVRSSQTDLVVNTNFAKSDPPKTGSENMAEISREEIDAKLAAIEARSDTRFEQMLGEMRTANAELRGEMKALGAGIANAATTTTVIWTGVGTFFALAALLVGVLAFGAQSASIGMSISDVAQRAADEAVKQERRADPAAPEIAPAPTAAPAPESPPSPAPGQ